MAEKNDALAAEFYQNYIKKAPDNNVVKAIQKNARNFRRLLKHIPKKTVGTEKKLVAFSKPTVIRS